jgi:Cu/Zn superoxide dismutase
MLLPITRFMLICASITALAAFVVSPSFATTAPKSWKVALGGNNPSPGDCTTNSTEKVKSVGSVTLILTATTFKAEIQLQHGLPKTSFGVYVQQVPGSCPQSLANGGTLTSNAAGGGSATATVPRVRGATSFFVQLVTAAGQAATYTTTHVSIKP